MMGISSVLGPNVWLVNGLWQETLNSGKQHTYPEHKKGLSYRKFKKGLIYLTLIYKWDTLNKLVLS